MVSLADNPQRLGKPLGGELLGLRSARRGDYRVIDELDDEQHAVCEELPRDARAGSRR